MNWYCKRIERLRNNLFTGKFFLSKGHAGTLVTALVLFAITGTLYISSSVLKNRNVVNTSAQAALSDVLIIPPVTVISSASENSFTFTIKNQGNASVSYIGAHEYSYQIKENGVVRCTNTSLKGISGLAAGSSITHKEFFIYSGGCATFSPVMGKQYQISITVDSGNLITELNETNNTTADITYTHGGDAKPDLYLPDTGTSYSVFSPGSLAFDSSIQNIGTVAVDLTNVTYDDFYQIKEGSAVKCQAGINRADLHGLTPGASKKIRIVVNPVNPIWNCVSGFTFVSGATYTLTTTLDVFNRLAEQSETNNVSNYTFTYTETPLTATPINTVTPTKPDLFIDSADISHTINPSGVVILNMKLQNKGGSAVNLFGTVHDIDYAIKEGSAVKCSGAIASNQIDGLGPNASVNITAALSLGNEITCSSGFVFTAGRSYTITTTLDIFGRVSESDETNNITNYSFTYGVNTTLTPMPLQLALKVSQGSFNLEVNPEAAETDLPLSVPVADAAGNVNVVTLQWSKSLCGGCWGSQVVPLGSTIIIGSFNTKFTLTAPTGWKVNANNAFVIDTYPTNSPTPTKIPTPTSTPTPVQCTSDSQCTPPKVCDQTSRSCQPPLTQGMDVVVFNSVPTFNTSGGLTLTTTIRNQGTTTISYVGAHSVRYEVKDGSVSKCNANFPQGISGLTGGSHTTYTTYFPTQIYSSCPTFTPTSGTQYTVVITVDSGNIISESNENNNSYTVFFTQPGTTPTSTPTLTNTPTPIRCTNDSQCPAQNVCDSTLKICVPVNVTTSPTPVQACDTVATTWYNKSITNQTSAFQIEFDATPKVANVNSVIGVSKGVASGYPNLATAVRFSPTGLIDARDGGSYRSTNASVSYGPNIKYHVIMMVDPLLKKYSVYVKMLSGNQMTVAENFSFRTEQANVSSIDNFGGLSTVSPGIEVCNVQVAAPNTTLTITPPVTPGVCQYKNEGNADCKNNKAGKPVDLADFEIWRNEYYNFCDKQNLTAAKCFTDEDGDGSLMDANFDYPGSSPVYTDEAVKMPDFEIWRKGYFKYGI